MIMGVVLMLTLCLAAYSQEESAESPSSTTEVISTEDVSVEESAESPSTTGEANTEADMEAAPAE
jgi:hypothetical protein